MSVLSKYRPSRLPCSVLVVDDDPDARQTIRRALEREGWSVSEGENGRVGLERVAESRPDIIVLDLMMPEMDGFQFISELLKKEGFGRIPIVVVTDKDVSLEDRQRLSGHVQEILHKGSYNRQDMVQVIQGLIKSRATGGSIAKSES